MTTPITGLLINRQEMASLDGLPHACYALYLKLRYLMDFKSGVVGANRKISWQALREELYVEPKQGRVGAGSPSKGKLRHLVEEVLGAAGLVINQSLNSKTQKQLIFYLPLATKGFPATKKLSTNLARKDSTAANPENSAIGQQETPSANPKVSTDKSRKVRTPQSNNNNTLYSNKDLTGAPINPNFKPSAETIAKAKDCECLPANPEQELQKFIAYYQASGKSYPDWNAAYLCWLLRGRQFQAAQNRRTNDESPRRKAQSAGEQVLAAYSEFFQADAAIPSVRE